MTDKIHKKIFQKTKEHKAPIVFIASIMLVILAILAINGSGGATFRNAPTLKSVSSIKYSAASGGNEITGRVTQDYPGFADPGARVIINVKNITFTNDSEVAYLNINVYDYIIYGSGYISLDGNDWIEFNLTPIGEMKDKWIRNSATATIGINKDAVRLSTIKNESSENYIVLYTCSKSNNILGIYCHDGWQIINFKAVYTPPKPPSPPTNNTNTTNTTNPGTGGVCAQKCDHIINLTTTAITASTFNGGIKPGDTVCLAAGTRGRLSISGLSGTSSNPITITNCNGQAVFNGAGITSHTLSISSSKHFRVTGTGDPNYMYGIKIINSGVGTTAGTSAIVAVTSSDMEFDHLEISGAKFAGLILKTDPSTAECNNPSSAYFSFTQYNTIVHDNHIFAVDGEGMYLGNSFFTNGHNVNCSGVMTRIRPHNLSGVRVYNNLIEDTGWDGLQIGCAVSDVEIYNNTILRAGRLQVGSQEASIQVNPGTVGKIYNNYIDGGAFGIFMAGFGDNKVYNNIILNSRADGIITTSRVSAPVMAGAGYNFDNNLIINPGSYGIEFNMNETTSSSIRNNIIVFSDPTKYIRIGSLNTQIGFVNSNNVNVTNIAALNFVNPAAGNYHLTSSSPAVDKGVAISWVNKDYDGASRPKGNAYDVGPYEFDGVATSPPPASAVDNDNDGYNSTVDCNDSNSAAWNMMSGYTDSDGDSYTIGTMQQVCSGNTLPASYKSAASALSDCNDTNSAKWQILSGYTDSDNDMYTVGAIQQFCTGSSLPAGNRNASSGTDCNDANANVNPAKTEICGNGIDENCDGVEQTCIMIIDNDNDGYNSTVDCNDSNAAIWTVRSGYADLDNDAFTTGSVKQVCSGAALPSGYKATSTTADCNDTSAAAWQLLSGYKDTDNDAFTTGSAVQVCVGASLPAGYRSASTTTDCNDNNANINPSKVEICGNGLDDDCAGGDQTCTTPPPYVPPTCNDGSMNGNETGVDCGGAQCTASCGSLVTFGGKGTQYVFNVSGNNITGYILYLPPNYNPNNKYPVMLFLHGAGEKFNNNYINYVLLRKTGIPQMMYAGMDLPFIVIMPQVGKAGDWNSASVSHLMYVLDAVAANYSVDSTRIYVTGLSMGGGGTNKFVEWYPQIPAAAVAIAGWGNVNCAKTAKIPRWSFTNNVDTTVDPAGSKNVFNSLKKCAGVVDPRLSVYNASGHDSWTKTYNLAGMNDQMVPPSNNNYTEEIYSWFLKYKRPELEGTKCFTCIVDYDGDGTKMKYDCNDLDYAIKPGAEEICGNTVDENCDGIKAGACASVDADGDGYDSNTDCNDANANINPGRTDICGNGIDEDCSAGDAACAAAPTCSDTIKNGDETGIDCGGSCSACFVSPPPSSSSSLVLGYSFQTSGATDISGNNRNAVVTGAIWQPLSGSGVYSFDGNDYMTVSNSLNLDGMNAITIEAWIYNDNNTNYEYVIGKRREENSSWGMYIHKDTKELLFFVNDGSNGPRTPMIFSQWVYVVGTWDGTTSKIYVNGVEKSNYRQAGPMGSHYSNVLVGARETMSGGRTLYQSGRTGEVYVYNSALSSSEILARYEATRSKYE